MQNTKPSAASRRGLASGPVILVLLGIGINVLGSWIAARFFSPLYLDSIGTLLTAVLGGYLPGIAVGLITNFAKGIILGDNSIYFASLNVLLALLAAFFAERGATKRILPVVPLCLGLALIGGGLGSVLNWFIGYRTEPTFQAQFLADFRVDLADKAISLAIVWLVVRLIPGRIRALCYLEGWKQTPLTREERMRSWRTRIRVHSLRTRILVLLSVAMLFIAITATCISFALYREATTDEYTKLGQGVTGLAKGTIDPSRVNEFLLKGEEAEGYRETKRRLEALFDSSPDIAYIYAYQIRDDGCHVVFDLDTEKLSGEMPGTTIPFDESFSALIPQLMAGDPIPPMITNDTYGWLLTVYEPLYDSRGSCVCYVAVDITMSTLVTDEGSFLAKMISLYLGFFILVLFTGLWMAEYSVILPVNAMSDATHAFAYNSEEVREENVDRIGRLDIRTGDEIENLYHAITQTTTDSMHYVADLQSRNEAIKQMQNGLILVLADMVESRDSNTGEHVRKTAAYTRIIMKQLRREGIYTDQLTDQFIYDVYHSAPLHDVGKITISDTILNKPGKLTDEEFAIMKTHTTAGKEVINNVIGIVPESDYLIEARNLAAHHHERWDGRGYPDGLAGEDIPLSARIMAVADVFDALVSKRAYKDGFPFEKAIAIIEEGVGTQFDPYVATAFLHVQEEARKIADAFGEGVMDLVRMDDLGL